jgi:hypothetical protein
VISIVLGRFGSAQLGITSLFRPPGALALIGRVPGATVTRICEGRGLHQFDQRVRAYTGRWGRSTTLLLKRTPGNADALHGNWRGVSFEAPRRIAITGCPLRRQADEPLLVIVKPPTFACVAPSPEKLAASDDDGQARGAEWADATNAAIVMAAALAAAAHATRSSTTLILNDTTCSRWHPRTGDNRPTSVRARYCLRVPAAAERCR